MMIYKILSDFLVFLHFIWILFMLYGFVLTFYYTIFPVNARHFFDRWLFRTLHVAGIFYVASLTVLGKYCPLTIWEYNLRQRFEPATDYTGSFIVRYIEKLVYPDVNPLIIQIPTILIAVFTVVVFVFRPPAKFKRKSKDRI